MKKYILPLVLITFSTSASLADSAYKWTDDQGRVFFGSKPPKNATGVTPVKAQTYSRYKASPTLAKLKNKNEARARLNPIKEADIPLPPQDTKDSFDVKPDTPTINTEMELTVESPKVKVGDQDEIESCAVTIDNKTPVDIAGVQISFEFGDGTLIPAVGPARINVGQSALFSVGAELLPLKLQAGTNITPKVIVNTDNDTVIKPPK